MKFKIFISVILISFLAGCNLLDIDPYSSIPAEDVFKTKKGLNSALIGVYDVLQSGSISQDATIYADLAADNLIHIGSKKEYGQVSDNQILTDNNYISGLWNSCYDGINRANNIFANIDLVSGVTENEKKNILGQCYFLRAYFYFNLVKFFGAVPLRTTPTITAEPQNLNITRTPESDIYEFIISDLKKSEENLAGSGIGNASFVNEGATKAFLARVYLYTKDWINADLKAQEVIAMPYILENSNFKNIFDESTTNPEIIFQIDFKNDQTAINGIADWTLSKTAGGRFEVAAWENTLKTSSIADKYLSSDLRKNTTIANDGSDFYTVKYTDFATDKDNIIVFRLAEMYLIRAEALNEIAYTSSGNAFNFLNTIRTRAGLSTLNSTTVTNQEDFRLAIENERRLEFAFEGHRFFDLKRTGRINQVLPNLGNLKAANWLFPIPQSEIDSNNDPGMVQNVPY